jgi:hypothetical protein
VNARQAVEEFSQSPYDAADGATLFTQLHRALSNSVVYVDDGWNQLVSALTVRADARRCLLGVGQRVTAIKPGQMWRVETGSGELSFRASCRTCSAASRCFGTAP